MRRVGLVLLLPLALAACSTSTRLGMRELTPTAHVQNAANKTAAAPSEHMTLRASLTIGAWKLAFSGSGDFDNEHHRGSFHLDVPYVGAVDEVVDGATIYVKSPLIASLLPSGKTWAKLDLKKARSSGGALPALLSQDPAVALARLKSLDSARKLGDETIAGTATTHYRGRVDLSKLPQFSELHVREAGHGAYDVWIGKDDGYVRRVRFSYSGGASANTNLVMTFSDFGKALTVSVPAASETFDAMTLAIPGLGG